MSKKAINKYIRRGIAVTQVNADNEFRVLEGELGQVMLNIVAADQHVGDVERSIRHVKEHTRCHVHRLPYRRYPTEMVCGALVKSTGDINRMILYDGITETNSPETLIEGVPGPCYKDIVKLNFGDYVQAHVPNNITNNNEARVHGAIALYPSGNAQGSWYFMSLETGKKVHRYDWDILPITKEVLDRVEKIAIHEGQALVASNFKYQWSPDGEEIPNETLNDDDDEVVVVKEEHAQEVAMEVEEW